MRTLETGQWLGTENQIRRLEQFRYGWKATDDTGATYRQDWMPNGLATSDDSQGEKVYTPWPQETP